MKDKTSIKISNMVLIAAMILIFAYFLSLGIRNVTVCSNIRSDELNEYQGNVEITKENRTRNIVYFIALDNGDIVRVNPDLLENGADLEQYEQLTVKYSEPKYGLNRAYTAVEISAGDNDTILLDDQTAYEEAKGGAYIGFIFSGVIALILISVGVGLVMIQKGSREKKNVRTKLDFDELSKEFKAFYEAFSFETYGISMGRAAEYAAANFDDLSLKEKQLICEWFLELFEQEKDYYGIPYFWVIEKLSDKRFIPLIRKYYKKLKKRNHKYFEADIDGKIFRGRSNFTNEMKLCKKVIRTLKTTNAQSNLP